MQGDVEDVTRGCADVSSSTPCESFPCLTQHCCCCWLEREAEVPALGVDAADLREGRT